MCQLSGMGSPGEGNGNPTLLFLLGNPADRGAWQATAHGVAESDTTEHAHTKCYLELSTDR